MRQFIDGNGNDSTAAVQAYLTDHNELMIADLCLIGEVEDPNAAFLTNWSSDLLWSPWGTFHAASISRGGITSKFGLAVDNLDFTWNAKLTSFGVTIPTSNPYQRAQMGFYDNMKFRLWRCVMPTPGDANTFGACEYFGGRIGEVTVQRGSIKFNVVSLLAVVNQQIPPNVIENTNTLASFKGATPPPGLTRIPQFNVIAPSTDDVLVLDCTFPTAHQIFPTNAFNRGFVVFNEGTGATLAGRFGIIAANQSVLVAGIQYNQVEIFNALPWPPTPGVDTCFISAAFPLLTADGSYFGFDYVPAPESAA